jgi:hypothetical protein
MLRLARRARRIVWCGGGIRAGAGDRSLALAEGLAKSSYGDYLHCVADG